MSALGKRIHVLGSSGAGKSTLAGELAARLGVPFVELDALHWEPGWRGADTATFHARLRDATRGEGWVLGGSYMDDAEAVCWDRLETIIYLDLPLPQVLGRSLIRSWRRWRGGELLWGTNYERFWPQLRLWDPESLLGYTLRTYHSRRRYLVERMSDPRWAHIRFIRLCSSREVDQLRRGLGI